MRVNASGGQRAALAQLGHARQLTELATSFAPCPIGSALAGGFDSDNNARSPNAAEIGTYVNYATDVPYRV
jgi:hypothetical protein